MRDYKDRRVTPPKRATSPTWGPPPQCKQALNEVQAWVARGDLLFSPFLPPCARLREIFPFTASVFTLIKPTPALSDHNSSYWTINNCFKKVIFSLNSDCKPFDFEQPSRMINENKSETNFKWMWNFNGLILDNMFNTKIYRVFSHDVTAAILVSQNGETAAMLVSQTNPLGVELFSYANAFFCSSKFA